jgi:energy-coupling factor transport system permease protein
MPVTPGVEVPAGRGKRKKFRRMMLLRFVPGDSFLHRLDPRTKLLTVVLVSAASLLVSSLAVMVLLFLFEAALAATSGLMRKFLRALTLVSPLFIMVIVLDSMFSKASSGPVLFSAQAGFLHLEVTPGSMVFAAAMGFRLLCLAGISFLFLMTTSQDEFVRSLKTMKVPPTLTFSLGYAMQSTTTLAEDTRQIMDAQRSRGLELDRGNFLRNWRKLTALFVPVSVSLLKRSKQTADAMQARGFCQSAPQSCYRARVFGRPDFMMVGVLLLLVLGILAIRLGGIS